MHKANEFTHTADFLEPNSPLRAPGSLMAVPLEEATARACRPALGDGYCRAGHLLRLFGGRVVGTASHGCFGSFYLGVSPRLPSRQALGS